VDDETPSVLDLLIRADIAEDRALNWLRAGAVIVDGERVTDPQTAGTPPARVVPLPS
jgi:hypothetical protein